MTRCVSVLYLLVSGTQSSGTLKMHNALMECDKNKIKWGIKELHICVHIFRDRMIQSHTEPRWRDEDVYLRRWNETTTKTTKNKNLIEFKLFKEIIQFYHHCDRTRKFVSLTYLFIIFFSSPISLCLRFIFCSVLFKNQPFYAFILVYLR